MNETIYIGVGSNIEPEINLVKALDLLCRKLRIKAVSTCYRNAPLGRPEQDDYINCVWQGESDLEAEMIKHSILRDIELTLGRVRTTDSHAAREIDLDLLLYGNRRFKGAHLTLPDPGITRRVFIALPLLELDPEIIIPGARRPLAELEILQQKRDLEPMRDLTQKLKARIQQEH